MYIDPRGGDEASLRLALFHESHRRSYAADEFVPPMWTERSERMALDE
jgi:hypothetical protein